MTVAEADTRRWKCTIADINTVAAGRGGAKGGICPGRHCAGAAFGGAKIWNFEIWPLLLNWR